MIEQRVVVTFSYPVHFCRGALAPENPLLGEIFQRLGAATRVLPVLDAGLLSHWPSLAVELETLARRQGGWSLAGPAITVPGGEEVKNSPELLSRLYEEIHGRGLDRHCVVLAIGGGAVLDAVGYAAATAHRGIRLVRMPTTVLAQNDAGVGVKNGVNSLRNKNFLGTFAPPAAVINDFDFLQTLEERDRRAGMAESVKVALIKDRAFFEWLEQHADALAAGAEAEMEHLIEHTARLHMAHISEGGDPFEMGRARPLDFGHWAAHKLETVTEHALRHGEAVAIGMALDVQYGVMLDTLPQRQARRVFRLLQRLGLPLYHSALGGDAGPQLLADALEEFRQHLGGELSVTQLRDLGDSFQAHSILLPKLEQARQALQRLGPPESGS